MPTFQKRGKAWRAIIRRKGHHPLSETFPTKGMAVEWAERQERAIAQQRASGTSDADRMTLRALIDWYVRHVEALEPLRRSKASDLQRIKGYAIAERIASGLRQGDYVRHVEGRRRTGAGPATVGNDLVWIRGVIKAARANLDLHASLEELADATRYLRGARVVAKPKRRDRRLKHGEEAKLLKYLDAHYRIPMGDIMRFALASTRRQDEITRLRWADLDRDKGVMALDDVKHPTAKTGNRKSFRILPEAIAIIDRQPRTAEQVFPYNAKTVGAYFTAACRMTGIRGLRFHDLRHEATSRLFERGYAIHEVAQFTLHESWATLRIYTNLLPENVPEK
jgi:integrase